MCRSLVAPGEFRLVGFSLLRIQLLTGICTIAAAATAAVAPYAPDAHTVYLLHLDEPAANSNAVNSAPLTLGMNFVAFDGNSFAGDGANQPSVTTVLGSTGFAGFGNCAKLNANDLGLGLDANSDGAFQVDDGSPASNDRLPGHSFFGPSNEFTLEALINVPSITSGNRQIISTDHGGPNNTDRGLQFRINSAGQLEFNFVGVSTTSIAVPIPIAGPHAFVANEWFHVALVYDGANALFFWTRMSTTVTNANLIGGPIAETVDFDDDALLVIGNEGRAVGPTGSTEGLLGLIDEVRISNTARSVTNFYWAATPTTNTNLDGLADGPLVNFVPIEDGDTNTSEFGYAGSSSINTVNFVHNALHTENGQQFIAYYYRHATSASNPNNNRIVVARRYITTNIWEMFFTTFTANNITDGHDVAAFGIDGNGFMHLSWGMHGDAFHYAKTTTSVFGPNAIVFGPDTTMTGRENSVTYPQWLRLPNGDLLYLFREGSSGNGDTFLNRYYVSSQTWSNVHISGTTQLPFLKGTGWNPNYNAYPNMPQLDADGNFHLIWTWRYQGDSPAGESGYQTNHDFDYARSTNGGQTWLRQNAVPYALPISQSGENGDPNTIAEKILTIPEGYSLINQAGMCLETNNSPVIATWWAPGTGTNNFRRQYMIAFRDDLGTWQVRQVSHRTNDPVGTKYNESFVRNLGRPVVVCDPVGRLIVLYRDNAGSNGLTIVHSLPYAVDPQRTNWTTFDLTTANLGNYEPVIDEARWELDSNLHIIHQPSQGEGYAPPANTAAEIGVVEWNAAAYFAHRPVLQLSIAQATNALLTFNAQPGWGYHVQTSTNLTTWENLTTLPGVMGQQAHTHTNALGASARYWRIESREGGSGL